MSLPGPVNVVELENGKVYVGHGDRFKIVRQPSPRSFDEEVTDLESRFVGEQSPYVVERRYTVERGIIQRIKAVVIRRK